MARRPDEQDFSASLTGKLAVLIATFLTVPIILYTQFHSADQGKQELLLQSVNEQARLVAQALEPGLREGGQLLPSGLAGAIRHLATDGTSIKVLFRPKGGKNPNSFFYVASTPQVPVEHLRGERERLIELGVLDRLTDTCKGDLPAAQRYTNPAGQEQVVTSVNPVLTEAGCWAIVIAHSTTAYQKLAIGRPYWETTEIRFAAIIYAGMALLVFTMFYGAWRSMRQFADLARSIRMGGRSGRSFAAESNVLEVAGLADELDRLVGALEESSKSIRQAAEENAHAFKTPVAVIRQSIEPLKRDIALDNERGARALEVIENSTERLDHLISCAWRMDEIAADLVDPPREEVEFSELLMRMMRGYADLFRAKEVTAETRVDDHIVVRAGEELIETVIENLVENALTFSSAKGSVWVSLEARDGSAVLKIEDQGPGVPDDDLERIFERYYSRHAPDDEPQETDGADNRHFGIGLWIVRRNVEAVGGSVVAKNRAEGGLCMTATLPLAT